MGTQNLISTFTFFFFLIADWDVTAVIQHKTPPKYKDPGCPTISCTIGDYIMEHVLLDLGASVNLIPFSVYQKFGLCELKPTSVTL